MNYLTNKSEKDHKEAYSFVQRGIKEGYFVPFFDYNVVLNFIALSSKLTLGNPIFQKYDVNHLFTNTDQYCRIVSSWLLYTKRGRLY